MRPRSAAEPKLGMPSQPDAGPCVDDLFRALVEIALRSTSLPMQVPLDSQEKKPEKIILDTEIDGSRYLLIRRPSTREPRVQLSPREHEIVRMVAEGHPNKVIAAVLSISSWTVCTHLRRIFAKLRVGSRAAMVARLLEQGTMSGHAPSLSEPSRVRPPSPTAAPALALASQEKVATARREPAPRRAC